MKKCIELSPMNVKEKEIPSDPKRSATAFSSSSDGTVRVVVRVRPLLEHEIGEKSVVRCQDNTVQTILNRIGNEESVRAFTFDNVLSPLELQEKTFVKTGIKLFINQALQGTNVSILAYGQTGSGKTYSMSGMIDETIHTLSSSSSTSLDDGFATSTSSSSLSPEAGIIPRACVYLFQRIQEINTQRLQRFPTLVNSSSSSSISSPVPSSVMVRASYCEIFNENVYDLLNLTGQALPIRYIPNQGFFVVGQVIVTCENASELMEVIKEGLRNRSVSSHSLNRDSSRSHSLLTIWIERRISTVSLSALEKDNIKNTRNNSERDELFDDPDDPSFTILRSKIIFVDLAGSERLKYSQSEGVTATETRYINKSLFVLGKVIAALSDRKPNTATTNSKLIAHIPYRDSKLTQLLSDSLGGTARTLLLSCISPAATYLDETLQTLQYSLRASRIENAPIIRIDAPHVNQIKTIKLLQQENERLKNENSLFRNAFDLGTDDIVTPELLEEVLRKMENQITDKVKTTVINDPFVLPPEGGTIHDPSSSAIPSTMIRPPPRRPTLPMHPGENHTGSSANPLGKGRGRSRKRNSMVGQHNGRQTSVEKNSVTDSNDSTVIMNNSNNASMLSFPNASYYGQVPRGTSHVAERIAQRAGSKLVIDVQQAELDALTAERNSLLTKHTAAKARINSLLTNINEYKTIINNLKNELDTTRKGRMDLEHYMLTLQQQQPPLPPQSSASSSAQQHRSNFVVASHQSHTLIPPIHTESTFSHEPKLVNYNVIMAPPSPRYHQQQPVTSIRTNHYHSTDEGYRDGPDNEGNSSNMDIDNSSTNGSYENDNPPNSINFQNISASITNHPSMYSNSQIPAYNHRRISQPAPLLRPYHEYRSMNMNQEDISNITGRPSGTAPP